MNGYIVIAESTDEPITVAEAAANIGADDDGNSPPGFFMADRIAALITAARQACEDELQMSLVRKTLEVAQRSFWCDDMCSQAVPLPWGPVHSIVSVNYLDADGADQVLASDQYRFSPYSRKPVLVPAYGVSLPAIRTDLDSVRVRYEAGFSSDDSPPQPVPEKIKQAMHLYIAHYWTNRDAVVLGAASELPLGARHLLSLSRRDMGV